MKRNKSKATPTDEEKFCIERILDDEETLFRIDPSEERWPVIQLYRNLFIVVLSIFILNPFYRSLAFLLMFLCFLLHDWHRMPYKHPYLNIVQATSSGGLLLITACNIPSSISFMGDLTLVPNMMFVLELLETFEMCLYAVLPGSFILWKGWERYSQNRQHAEYVW